MAFIQSGLPCRAESCATTVPEAGPSRLPWGRYIGSTHGISTEEKPRSLSSWIALSRPKALGLVRLALGT